MAARRSYPCYSKDGFEYIDEDDGIAITSYKGIKTEIVIPKEMQIGFFEKRKKLPVVTIGWLAFSGRYLKNVVIPDSVKEIDNAAFAGNSNIKLVIPDSVKINGDLTDFGFERY